MAFQLLEMTKPEFTNYFSLRHQKQHYNNVDRMDIMLLGNTLRCRHSPFCYT